MNRRVPTFALVAIAAASVLPGPASADKLTCFGHEATIVGTNRDPQEYVEIVGTPGDDVIVGLKGSDEISARGGDDLICSGGADDFIYGGSGHDRIRSGDGVDDVHGGTGGDFIRAGDGPAESLFGDGGSDELFGDNGNEDYLFGGRGDDLLDGGEGNDILMFADAPRGVSVDLALGTATGHGDDRLVALESVIGSAHDDRLYGDEADNTLAGGPGSDEHHGLGGNDRLRSGWGGTDVLDGGQGIDAANYYLGWDPVDADLAAGVATTSGLEPGEDSLIDIENLVGSKFGDTLIGDDYDNMLHGSLENDTISGGRGTDLAAYPDSFELEVDLIAGTAIDPRGSDMLKGIENVTGSSFADTIIGSRRANVLLGWRGDDELKGRKGGDTLVGENHIDAADGGIGDDTCEAETEAACEIDPDPARVIGGSFGGGGRDDALRGLLSRFWSTPGP